LGPEHAAAAATSAKGTSLRKICRFKGCRGMGF
jgi:hypothetical protein